MPNRIPVLGYRLRTLLIVLAIAPFVLAGVTYFVAISYLFWTAGKQPSTMQIGPTQTRVWKEDDGTVRVQTRVP